MVNCKLCRNMDVVSVNPPGDERDYFLCTQCNLIFVDPQYYPSREFEKERYLQHNNCIENTGYVDFLRRVIQPSLDLMHADMKCLDFGCGPTPVLSELLSREGYICHNYDPIYGFDHPLNSYDFIFSTECFEHFFDPGLEMKRIGKLLNVGGYLGVMTEQWESLEQFITWYYKRDFTHVTFYHFKTMEFIGNHYGYDIVYRDRNRVVIMKKTV